MAKEKAKEAEHQTWHEKHISRKLIAAAKMDVLDELEEAQLEMERAIAEKKAEYEAKVETEMQHSKTLQYEHQHWWDEISKSHATANAKLEAERRGFEAMIEYMKQKHSREMNRLNTRIDDKDAEILELEEKHADNMKKMELELERQKDLVHEEKQRRRQTEQKAADITAECNKHIKAMDLWMMEVGEELKVQTICVDQSIFYCY